MFFYFYLAKLIVFALGSVMTAVTLPVVLFIFATGIGSIDTSVNKKISLQYLLES